MPHTIGYVDNTSMLAHYAMLELIKDFADSNGWDVLRYNTGPANRELILKGYGYTGEEDIFIGFRTYQDAASDYYNLVSAVFTGFVPGNTFDTQPGAYLSGVPAHNQRIDYWLTLNPQRIAFALKVGTPVYVSAYAGKCLPYARPGQYPNPLVCGGMLAGTPATRFSDTTGNVVPYKGNRAGLALRTNDGWLNAHCYPFSGAASPITGSGSSGLQLRDTEGTYPLLPIELHDNAANLWGALDGIYFIPGFGNAVENTLTVGDDDFIVVQDLSRTGFSDYYAMRLDQ